MNKKLIESKQFVPWVVRQSRDIQVYCKLIDLLINDIKTRIDNWTNLIDVNSCPDNLLPLLASYVGYKYNYQESYDSNRLIIKNYPYMMRNRGNEIGISLATALGVNTLGEIDKVEALSMFRIDYDKSSRRIDVYVFYPVDFVALRNLIELVRPAGCNVMVVPSELIQTIDGIKIHSYETHTKYPYDSTRYSVSELSRVGFSEVVNESIEN